MNGQVKDEILINGVSCSVISNNITIPKESCGIVNFVGGFENRFDLVKGYLAKWEIKDNSLHLNWISSSYNLIVPQAKATWFSGEIIVSQFNLTTSVILISIDNGNVTSAKLKNTLTGYVSDVNISIDRGGIKQYVESRNVSSLFHFTNVKNIPSIMTNGLLGMNSLGRKGIETLNNDMYRLDAVDDSICLSISFVNYKMFYKLRCENPEEDWAVIEISPSVLWDKPCVFCSDNAASSGISSISPLVRMDLPSLESMFCDNFGFIKRSELNIPSSFTTNPQAEIMALNGVEVDYIKSINIDVASKVKSLDKIINDNQPFRELKGYFHNGSLFTYRTDFSFW